jgi:hypothetical protein
VVAVALVIQLDQEVIQLLPTSAPAGTTGVGGLLILIVRGNVTVNGTISNNGSNGGNSVGTTSPSTFNAGGGGEEVVVVEP